jgi:hypothetical protein
VRNAGRGPRRLTLVWLTVVLLSLGAAPLSDGRRSAALAGTVPAGTLAGTVDRPGYHHLGATSAGGWTGVLGRLTVRDPGVRAGTYDFVAARFMAKRESGGRIAWLEAGWAETGWSGEGRQRIYTYDTTRNTWTFHDQYRVRDGDQVWVHLHADPAGSTWRAWLWWGDGWRLLAAVDLPLGPTAQVEQYVEVHVDSRRGGGRPEVDGFPVPPVAVDNVHVRAGPDGALRRWGPDVPTTPGPERGRYCVDWRQRFDTWTAGDCRPG